MYSVDRFKSSAQTFIPRRLGIKLLDFVKLSVLVVIDVKLLLAQSLN